MIQPLTRSRAAEILAAAAGKKVLVVGDVILDHYVQGTVTRVSPEAPVPVLKVEREWYALGGAGNVAANVSRLGATTELCSVAGPVYLSKLLTDAGIGTAGVWQAGAPKITVKTRFVTAQQPLLRVDKEDCTPLSSSACGMLRIPLTEQLIKADMVVISDYAKGVVTQELLTIVSNLCGRHNKPLCIGPKPRPDRFGFAEVNHQIDGAWLCFNMGEAERMLIGTNKSVYFRTEGAHGITVIDIQVGSRYVVPALAVPVVDVCGAGDTVLAMVAMARLGGATPVEAAQLANAAAAVVVGKKGTATASVEEVLALLT